MTEKEALTRKIGKLADFQMRKSTHQRFLENCIAENVVPNGLQLKLQVHVGNNDRLQAAVNRILSKTSMEIARLVAEHSLPLIESKLKMAELDEELKMTVNNEGEVNTISEDFF